MIAFSSANIRTWSMLGSNGAFGFAALELPEIDENLAMLTADEMYFSGLERFGAKYPQRLYNIGIAEQNMVGIAGGMSKEGMNVFATTYATFASTRSADQVRVNMGYMKLGIKLVGLTAGLSVGSLGATHCSVEDIAIMRAIPNITILSPADCTETVKATLAAARHKGPVYLRLTGGQPNLPVYKSDYEFEIGKAIRLREGEDIAVIATGSMVYHSLEAAAILAEQGISSTVIDMHTIKPLDEAAILDTLGAKLLVTVEEHSRKGGLGGAVAECLAGVRVKPPQLIIGIADEFKTAADYPYLLKQFGLTGPQIAQTILQKYDEVKG
ncbi:MAG TPA: transketolase C-terminal domain-containing protein [Bryobacteraceae bacterium]|jgi:transketolase|nr:transketolase C-terminal domain-containing protein [Bryobacteraceae bacterium]